MKQIKMALNEKSGKDEEYKVKVIALRTTSNIHTLIKVSKTMVYPVNTAELGSLMLA